MKRAAEILTRKLLGTMSLPELDAAGDKNDRGIVLVIGGSDCVPGAVMLSGIGALRAGAGKLQLATVRNAAIPLAMAVPEAMVLALPTSRSGEIAPSSTTSRLQPHLAGADALLFGPGMSDDKTCARLLEHFTLHLKESATVVLDSAAIMGMRHAPKALQRLAGRLVITPHAGEMAQLMDITEDEVKGDPRRVAEQCAELYQAVVVMKGADTFIAQEDSETLCYSGGGVGMATSGSGDTLSGIIAGLGARGASPRIASAWGVWSHGSAGNKLSKSVGTVGYLARELLAEIPQLLTAGA